MKFAYENLEIWQLGMKLVELVYSLKDRFPPEDRFGLWDQLSRSAEAVPRAIAEGYVKSSIKERALYMERAASETAETDTTFKQAAKKGRITEKEYRELIRPLITELYFKIIGYRKWILSSSKRRSKRVRRPSDPPIPPSEAIHQVKRSSNSYGFTLIELLVVVAILATVGVVATNMFFQILKGASKAEIEKMVKQEGEYAISVMERMIRNAKSVKSDCDASFHHVILMKNQDEGITAFECITGDAYVASNSARLTSDKVAISSDCNQFVRCTQTGSSPPVVEIDFDLSQRDSSPRPEEQATVKFQTTVSLRSY